MSLHDDFDIEISENKDSELSEKEYLDMLGLVWIKKRKH